MSSDIRFGEGSTLPTATHSFRQFPRIMLSRFFTAPEVSKGLAEPANTSTTVTASKQAQGPIVDDRRPKGTTADNSHPVPVSVPAAHDVPEAARTGDTSPPASSASIVTSSEDHLARHSHPALPQLPTKP